MGDSVIPDVRTRTLRDVARGRQLDWLIVRTIAVMCGVKVVRVNKHIVVSGEQLKKLESRIDDYVRMDRSFV